MVRAPLRAERGTPALPCGPIGAARAGRAARAAPCARASPRASRRHARELEVIPCASSRSIRSSSIASRGRVDVGDCRRIDEHARGAAGASATSRSASSRKYDAFAKKSSFEKRNRTRPGIVSYSGWRSMLRKRKSSSALASPATRPSTATLGPVHALHQREQRRDDRDHDPDEHAEEAARRRTRRSRAGRRRGRRARASGSRASRRARSRPR